MYAAAASAALSIYGAAKEAKAKAEEDTANNIAQQEKRRLEFNREQQAFLQNMNASARQNTADNFNIGLAAAEAEDQLALAKAGSGLAGASINELDDEISRSVGADRVAARREMIEGQDRLNQQRLASNENRLIEANQARSYDYNQGIKEAVMGGVFSVTAAAAEKNSKRPKPAKKNLEDEESRLRKGNKTTMNYLSKDAYIA